MTLIKIGKSIVRAIDGITDLILYVILGAALLFGVYSLWESRQVYRAAEADNYTAYRPAEDDSMSFEELRAVNPEVMSWLTVNDTPIDYPVTQTDDNEKYVSTNVMGEFAMSGCIFLDYRNSPDYSDRVNILYGHYMERKLMFGVLGDFAEQSFLEAHPWGNLFYEGKDHGLEFFALVLTDAYDQTLYDTEVDADEKLAAYLDAVRERAITWRDTDLDPGDRLVVLSTCTTQITNGRYLLLGRFTKELHLQEKEEPTVVVRLGAGTDRLTVEGLNSPPIWVWAAALAVLLSFLAVLELTKHSTTRAPKRAERKEKEE